jgi:signal transduction histidine kinase
MSESRVLLVEDEPGYARFLREVLAEAEGSAHELTWAASLERALQHLRESRYDIVLLDLGLPDADGNEALTRVAATVPAVPIVVLSARHDLEVALESMRLGAQEYLVKGQAENVLLPRAIRYAVERKRLQDAAALARQEAERANAVKDEFLAMLGHELRNPLAPIVTGLELIRQRGATGLDRELTIIERQVRHLVRLVDDLLDVSRIARGKIELDRAQVDIADAVADGVEAALPLFSAQCRNLTVDVPRNVLFVEADRMRLAQVIANLLTNAGKYTKPGGNVVLSARAEAGELVVRVRDDGIGMDRELLARAFHPFEQGARPLDRSAGGLGLGLAIVKSIVTLHGGTISVDSTLNRGTRMSIRLPGGDREQAS